MTSTNIWGADGLVMRGEEIYLCDPLGNVAVRLNTDGDVLASDAYDAWGNLLACDDPDGDPYDLTGEPYGYKAQYGYYTDRETGLILCTHRYYDPDTGRWVTRDPIGYDGGINLYQYCGNDPVDSVDSTGYSIAHLLSFDELYKAFVGRRGDWGDFIIKTPTMFMMGVSGANQYDVLYKHYILINGEDNFYADSIKNSFLTEMNTSPSDIGERYRDVTEFVMYSGGNFSFSRNTFSSFNITSNRSRLLFSFKPLLGRNPRNAGTRINTDLPGGRAVAKSIFKYLSNGQVIKQMTLPNGATRRYTIDDKFSIRMNTDGTSIEVRSRRIWAYRS